MYNKKALRDIVKNLGSAKAPTKKRDIIYDPMGQWTNPGQNTRVPTPNGNITMGANPETGQPIPFPVFAQPNVGPGVMMQPGQDYTFPGAEYVDEFPQVKKGGLVKQPKKYSKSLMAKNILFVKNALLSKKKSAKNKIFDPNSPYFQDGGTFEIELDENEIDQYRKGGYIVEDVEYDKGGSSGCPKGEYWDGTKCVKIPKNTRIVYHTDKDVYDKAFAAESDSSHFYNNAKSDFNKIRALQSRIGTSVGNAAQDKARDAYFKEKDRQEKKWHTDNYKPGTTINHKYIGPKSNLKIKPVGLERNSDGYAFPKFKKPVVHNVYEEPIKQPLPTTRTVYIDCPPGSVANGQKTDVTTHDPDSPGNYLRTITTGCDPIKEKEVIVPIKEPVKSTEEVPMDTQEYPEELEGPNWEWDKKWHSFNTPRLNKHFPLGPLFNGKKKHTFSTPYLHRRKDYEDGGIIGDFSTNQIQEYINGGYIVEDISVPSLTRMNDGAQVKGLQGLNADFSTNLTAFINAAKADGIDLGIGSGFRSVEKQKQLWEQALKKYGTPEKARKWVAPPGRSNHNRGTAVDLNSSGAFLGKNKNTKATQWAHANAEKFGLHFRMGHEPWHIEPLNLSKEQKAKIDAEHQHSDNEDPNTHVDPNNVKALSKEGIDMTKYYKNLGKEQEITDIDNDYSNWNPQEEVIVDPRIAQLEAYSKLMSPSIQNVNDMYAATKVNQQQQQKQFAMGGYIDTELTDKEITNYKNGGYIVEYLD